MDKKIKSAFNEIKAEEQLKASTEYYLNQKYFSSKSRKNTTFFKPALAFSLAFLTITLCFSFITYTIPVGAISLDGNSGSIELGINRFDKVVKITCFGENKLTEASQLKNMNYKDAVECVLEKNESNSTVLTVSCKNASKQKEIANTINSCNNSNTSVNCHQGKTDISNEAHSHGISTGKYNAYLLLKQLAPETELEEIKNLTMKQILDKINSLSPKEADEKETVGNSSGLHPGNGHHGKHATDCN